MATVAKYQVFISSTFEDLKDERNQVIRAVLEMGHIPVGMEMFSAADEEQWRIIARHIDESDYYAVVAAHRLGSLTENNISYTRKEYEYAKSKGIPILGFVLEATASWPADMVDKNSRSQKALKDFKNLIQEKPVSFWSSAEDLHGKFSVALMKAITANPREGWIRASAATTSPGITAEIVRLSSENAELRQRLEAAENAATMEHKEENQRTIETLFATVRNPSYRYTSHGEWQKDAEITLFEVYVTLAQEMLVEAPLSDMANTLAMNIRKDREQSWDIVAVNQLKGLIADLMTLDLVEPSSRKHPVSDTNEYWTLTSAGIAVFKLIQKTTLGNKTEEAPDTAESDEVSGDDESLNSSVR